MSVFVSERRLQLGIGPSLEASPLEAPGGAAGRPHYASLDILRLVACALVFVHHGLLDRINIVRSLCDRMLPGSLGVNIFFVLSGFLIVNLLIQNRRQNVPTHVFYFKRFARTMPAYFLLMAVYSLLQWHWLPWSIWTYTYNLGPIFGAKYVLNEFQYHDLAPTWSLDVEEQFYLWIPLVVYLLSPKPRRLFLVGIIGLGLLSAHRMNGTEFAGYIAPFPNFVGLACGGLLAEYKDQLFAIKMLPWFAATMVIGALVLTGFDTSQSTFGAMGNESGHLARIVVALSIVVAAISLIDGSTISSHPLLRAKPFRHCAAATYECYLFHGFVFRFLGVEKGQSPSWTAIVGAVAFTLAIALFVYFLVELPIRRHVERMCRPLLAPAK